MPTAEYTDLGDSQLPYTSKLVSRAFGDALAAAGGLDPRTVAARALRLMAAEEWRAQQRSRSRDRDRGAPILTHSPRSRSRKRGSTSRTRDARRPRAVTRSSSTDAGREKHAELVQAVIALDRQLRSGLEEAEIQELSGPAGEARAERRAPTRRRPTEPQPSSERERLERQLRRDDALAVPLVDDVDRVVLPVRARDADDDRRPAPEAEPALRLQLARRTRACGPRRGSRRPPPAARR